MGFRIGHNVKWDENRSDRDEKRSDRDEKRQS